MITYENECCGCAVPGYPCIGSACPNRNVPHMYCDMCGEEVEKLYKYDGEEICEDCLLSNFESIGIDDSED